MRLTIFYIILIECFSLSAQTKKEIPFALFMKEYKELIDFQPSQNYGVGIHVEYFDSEEKLKLIQEEVSELKVLEKNRYAYNTGANIQIQDGEIRLDIDTVLKRVLVSKAKLQNFEVGSNGMFEKMDSTVYSIGKLSTKDLITYEITELKQISNYQKITFIFDFKTKNFKEMHLLLWPANYTRESLEDETIEQPFIVYSYSSFKTIKENELKLEELTSSWCIKNKEGALISTKSEYQLHDLR